MSKSNSPPDFRQLPSVDALIQGASQLELPHALKREEARRLVEIVRNEFVKGKPSSREDIQARFHTVLIEIQRSLRSVINATGVILHTGLGRAPYSASMLDALQTLNDGYVNLELDLPSGKRGNRHDHLRPWLRALSGAEDGLLVNNNAAAVLLALNTFADKKEVVVSRGQQVEIGGSFRIPDIIRKAGARLVEVGTTNRTHSRDFREAISPRTRMLLWVHTSNYRVEGFTKEVALTEMVEIAHANGILCMADLGSGALTDISVYGLKKEPLITEVMSSGVDLVTFSVDKLLGGPQGGILVGSEELIHKVERNNLLRTLRPDKLHILLTLEALKSYQDDIQLSEVLPVYRDFQCDPQELKTRAEAIRDSVTNPGLDIDILATRTQVGSGASPLETLPSFALVVKHTHLSARRLASDLRMGAQAVLGRVEDDGVFLDLRAVRSHEDKLLIEALQKLG